MRFRYLLAIALLSVALIAYQLALMQLLSISQWHHFAYMVIAVALLGFGASGTVIALARNFLLNRIERLFPLLCFSCAISMAVVPELCQQLFGGFDSFLLFADPRQVVRLLLTDLLFFIPFLLGALAIGLAFVRHVTQIGKLYFANLLGSGVGGVAVLVMMWHLLPGRLPAATALFALAAGFCSWSGRKHPLTAFVASISITFCGFALIDPPRPVLSQYKDLSYALDLPEAHLITERPSPYGLVQILGSPAQRSAPGISLNFPGQIPTWPVLFNNGNAVGPVIPWPPAEKVLPWEYTADALPYAMTRRENVLVLQSATGWEIAQALAFGAERVKGVEAHRTVIDLMENGPEGAKTLLFQDPRVQLLRQEPRTSLAAAKEGYDLIALPRLGSFGGGTGLLAMQEEYLITREAFRKMWQLLTPDGVIRVSSWLDFPPRRPLKLLATMVEMLEEAGIDNPRAHLAAVRDWQSVTFVVKKSPLTAAETEGVHQFCRKLQLDPLFLPGLEPEKRVRFHLLEDKSLLNLFDRIMQKDRKKLYSDYDFLLLPATDDRPFFSQFLRWQSLPRLRALFGGRTLPFFEMGYLIVLLTLLQMTMAAAILILLPLLRLGWKGPNKRATFLYFSALGLGYMFFEMVLIHKLVLYLGQPIYAAAASIAALLIFSGAGSYFSSRLSPTRQAIKKATLKVALLIAAYALFLPAVLSATIALPLAAKASLAFMLIAVPAFCMGFPFPLGLRRLDEDRPEHIPWAWGINGCVSVLSTALATIAAVELGFSLVMIIAAAAYLAAMLNNL